MLFQTIDEFKMYLPASGEFEMEDIIPFIRTAEEYAITPFLSQTQYDSLHTAYVNNSMTANDEKLLDKVRRPLANRALADYIPFGNVTFGKGTMGVVENSEIKVASQWRVQAVKDECEKNYYNGTEKMLLFLEQNKTIYTLWAASTSFTQFKECFINTADEFNQYFFIDGSRRVFLMMRGVMKMVEQDQIRSVTGTALFNAIKTEIASGTVSSNNAKLMDFIKPCVAYSTAFRALSEMTVKWTDKGIQILSERVNKETNNEADAATNEQSYRVRQDLLKNGESYKKQLINYLYRNHATYSLYESDNSVYQSTPTSVNDRSAETGCLFI